jgi:hypothetical protein
MHYAAFKGPTDENCMYPGCPEKARRAEFEHRQYHPDDVQARHILCTKHRDLAEDPSVSERPPDPVAPAAVVVACHACGNEAPFVCAFCRTVTMCRLHSFRVMHKLKVEVCCDCAESYQPNAEWSVPVFFKN